MAPADSIIPAHSLAVWLLRNIDRFLDMVGLDRYHSVEQLIYFAIIVAASYFIGWIIRWLILWVSQRFVKIKSTEGGNELLREHTLTRCSHIIPPIVFLSLAPFAFDSRSATLTWITRASLVYLSFAIAVAINAIFTFVFTRYDKKVNRRNLPIKGVLNVIHGIVWIIAIIVSVSIIVDKSPATLLGGLTAFAAVLMLIFKDSILGLVAGVQMTQNDMLHVGDWIVVPSTPANGIVEDVSLTTVKVRNFDNTLVTVPPYTLVSSSFQNWKGMSDSGVRRIEGAIYINPDTVIRPTADQLKAYGDAHPQVKDFIESLQSKGQTVAWNAGVAPANGTIETNLGVFRYFLVRYLLDSPMINKDNDLMVRVLQMSPEGIPLEIYCFAVTTQWESYEGVQSAVFEYAISHAADFGLQILSGDFLKVETGEAKSTEGKA
ncbi:MAG: mechanosensitive ion channel [Clostridium sp.]|nr:mechanosensitive ion channel [Clostridium sp.]